jgi:flagellar brake protein
MSMMTPFPEPDSPELERFAVYSQSEIVSLLRELAERQVLVTLYYDQSAGFAVSNVLDVNAGFEELLFDCASDPAAQQAIYASKRLVMVAFLDNVKLQCVVGAAEPIKHHGRSAFRVRLPQQMLRMQRRNHSRHQPVAGRPANCLVPSPRGEGQYESLRVLDLSVGGLAVLAHPTKFDLPAEGIIEQCYLDLPEVGQITVNLRLRYVDPISESDGATAARRCGCEFVNLSGPAARLLQRYMNKLDAAGRNAETPPDRAAA